MVLLVSHIKSTLLEQSDKRLFTVLQKHSWETGNGRCHGKRNIELIVRKLRRLDSVQPLAASEQYVFHVSKSQFHKQQQRAKNFKFASNFLKLYYKK
jgi:hypothetical protein